MKTSSSKTLQGFVGSYNDWYAVSISGTQTLNLDLGTTSGAAKLTLYDPAGHAVQTVSTGTGDAWLTRTVTSGRYTIAVTAQNGAAAYALTAGIGTPIISVEDSTVAGNSLATARSLSASLTMSDWLGTGDSVDWYKFSVSAASIVVLTLSGLDASATLVLRDAAGQVILQAPGSATSAASIKLPVAAGTYSVTVESDATTGYSLNYGTVPDPDTAGNSIATAKALGTLSTIPVLAADHIDRADPADFYSFNVGALARVNLVLSGLSAAATLTLYAPDGTVIARTTGGADHQTAQFDDLAPLTSGTYTIGISGTNTTAYSLAASATTYVDSAGNTSALARYVTALSTTPQTFVDSILPLDPQDWYSFVLGSTTTVNFALSGLTTIAPSPVRYTLFGPSGDIITTDSAGEAGNALDAVRLQAGSYLVLVDKPVAGGSGAYSLSLSTGSPAVGSALIDSAANTPASGRDLGPLTARPLTLADWVGGADPDDYYRFVLGTAGLVRLDLAGLTAPVTATLRDGTGSVVATSVGTASNGVVHEPSLTPILKAGSYTLDVSGTGTGTGYSLTAAASALFDGAGNSPGSARQLGVLNIGGQVFSDTLGAFDTSDAYQFTLSAASTVNILVNGLTSPALLSLADAANTPLGSNYGATGGEATASLIETLAPGTYTATLGVNGGSATSYAISLSATPVPTSAAASAATATSFGTLGSKPVVKDFNGDGTSDLLLRNAAAGFQSVWLLDGSSVTGSYVVGGDPSWSISGTADLAGNGHADLLWRGPGGNTFGWLTDGTTVTATSLLGGDDNWSIAGTGDFDGDGKADIVWQDVAGPTVLSFQDGLASRGIVTLNTASNWSAVLTGDFDGDGKTDLLWRDSNSGGIVGWLMNGPGATAAHFMGGDLNWRPIFTGDFDGDGRDDIIWRNSSTGATSMWLMNGLGPKSAAAIGGDTDWSVASVGDYDGDGKADLVWRSAASGTEILWTMNGTAHSSATQILSDATWTPSI